MTVPDVEIDGPEWLSPLLLLGICTSCIGLAGAGALAVAVLGAFWANAVVGVGVAGLVGGWLYFGNPLRERDTCEVEPGTSESLEE